MVGYENNKAELDALGIKVFAASVDPIDKAKEVADEVSFPIGYGVTKDLADSLDAWWEERRQIIQPTAFILNSDNKVMGSCYADGPLGRIQAEDVISLVKLLDSKK
ncbi:MAG: redoxin domain-containing protein [Alphaproteobacteria bacterium]|nr:redoxin domain-containing protein [Alphaproteobacteria bacterium]